MSSMALCTIRCHPGVPCPNAEAYAALVAAVHAVPAGALQAAGGILGLGLAVSGLIRSPGLRTGARGATGLSFTLVAGYLLTAGGLGWGNLAILVPMLAVPLALSFLLSVKPRASSFVLLFLVPWLCVLALAAPWIRTCLIFDPPPGLSVPSDF